MRWFDWQVTIFGESAGGWSVSHQLVRLLFLNMRSVKLVEKRPLISIVGCYQFFFIYFNPTLTVVGRYISHRLWRFSFHPFSPIWILRSMSVSVIEILVRFQQFIKYYKTCLPMVNPFAQRKGSTFNELLKEITKKEQSKPHSTDTTRQLLTFYLI